VIEDEPQTRDIFLECLEAEGFDTICAENGREGVQRAQQQLPDLVICDVMMPEMDGFYHTPPRPCDSDYSLHFITAASKAELRQGMELGADDYLIKPLRQRNYWGRSQLGWKTGSPGSGSRHSPRVSESPVVDTAKPAAPKSIFPSSPT